MRGIFAAAKINGIELLGTPNMVRGDHRVIRGPIYGVRNGSDAELCALHGVTRDDYATRGKNQNSGTCGGAGPSVDVIRNGIPGNFPGGTKANLNAVLRDQRCGTDS